MKNSSSPLAIYLIWASGFLFDVVSHSHPCQGTMEKDRHKYGFHCAGWIEKSLFPFFSWIARQRSPSNTNRPSVLVALNPYVYADEIAKCEEFASAEFGPCSCLPCPQWISFDHFWSINQESPRTQNISKGPCLTFTSLVPTRSMVTSYCSTPEPAAKISNFPQGSLSKKASVETATLLPWSELCRESKDDRSDCAISLQADPLPCTSPGEAWEQGLQHRKRLCSRAFLGLL